MISSLSDLRIYLKEDMKRMGGGKINPIRWIMGENNSRMRHYIYVLRLFEYNLNKYKNGGIMEKFVFALPMILFMFLHRRQCFKYGVNIGPNMCDYGLRIVHPGGIHINANRVGKYCSVNQGVVLGKIKCNENRPYVGDNVTFSIGSVVTGKVYIGNNVTVCPNSVVIKNLPDNVIASGVPVNIVKIKKQ